MKKWRLFLAVCLLLSSSVVSMAAEVPSTAAQPTDFQLYEELIVGTATAMDGKFFTSLWGNNTADIDVRTLLHDYSLVEWRSADSVFLANDTVVTGLAATTDKQGNKQYVAAIAEGLKYSDGTPITARDYVFSILLMTSPELAELGGMTAHMNYIQGAQEYTSGQNPLLSGVRLLSERQFSITIRADYLPFFYEIGLLDINPYPISVIAPGCEVADDGKGAYIRNIPEDGQTTEELKKAEPLFTSKLLEKTIMDPKTGYMSHPSVTSGPYVLKTYDPKTAEATFEINPNFIGVSEGKLPVIQRLVYRYVAPDKQVEALEKGEIQLINKGTLADVVDAGLQLRAKGNTQSINYMRTGLSFISFNCEQGPVQFQRVRQALALALDRDQFIGQAVKGYGMKVNGYYGLGQWMAQLVSGTLAPPEDQADKMDEWQKLTQEGLSTLDAYTLDLERAKALLVRDGWTLNKSGKPFTEGKDSVRAKDVDGELMLLDLELCVPKDAGVEALFDPWKENLTKLGARLTIKVLPFEKLLRLYYRQEPRNNDMFFLGSNFDQIFDSVFIYSTKDEDQGTINTTGLRDEKLMRLGMDMHKTEPGDVLSYCQKWLVFQQYWNETLPMIPLYSNVYFDFYTSYLRDYAVDAHVTWSKAVQYSYLSDATEEEELLAAEEPFGAMEVLGADELIFGQ